VLRVIIALGRVHIRAKGTDNRGKGYNNNNNGKGNSIRAKGTDNRGKGTAICAESTTNDRATGTGNPGAGLSAATRAVVYCFYEEKKYETHEETNNAILLSFPEVDSNATHARTHARTHTHTHTLTAHDPSLSFAACVRGPFAACPSSAPPWRATMFKTR
jgi:hypothetical protein